MSLEHNRLWRGYEIARHVMECKKCQQLVVAHVIEELEGGNREMNKDKQCVIIACETDLLPTQKQAKALLDISKFIKKQPIKTRLVLKLGSAEDWIEEEKKK